MTQIEVSALLSTLCCVTLAACSGGDDGPMVPPGQMVIEITPSPLNLVVGGTGTVGATARDAAGKPLPVSAFAWSIENSAIATVTGNGTVQGVSRGTTTVYATSGTTRGAGIVHVDQLAPTSLVIVPATASTTVGGTVVFAVIARDANGQVMPPPPSVVWSSSSPAVATIDAGVATGVSAGSTQIGARAGSVTATPATLTVTPQNAGPCDGILSVNAFDARISYQWAHEATVDGHHFRAEHGADIAVKLTRLGGPVPSWWAPTQGTGRITDRDTSLGTGKTARIDAQGALISADRPTVDFDVDLATCRYSLRIIPWLNAVLTDFDGGQQNSPFATGHLFTGWIDLGDWRGLNAISELDGTLPAHSFLWILSPGNALLPSYLPSGFGMLLWGSTAGGNETKRGDASISWAITVSQN